MEGLCDSLEALCIASPNKRPSVKCRLSNILYKESTSKDEATERTPVKKRFLSDSDSEDDALPSTSTMSVAECPERASSSKKKSKKTAKKAKNQ